MENLNSEVVVNSVVKVENPSYTLIKALKAEIIRLTDLHIERKRKGFRDHFESQEIRAHLIAYCLLRGKSYKNMERKCDEFNVSWWHWHTLIRNINKVCMKYSLTEDHENWTVQKISQIISEARADD